MGGNGKHEDDELDEIARELGAEDADDLRRKLDDED